MAIFIIGVLVYFSFLLQYYKNIIIQWNPIITNRLGPIDSFVIMELVLFLAGLTYTYICVVMALLVLYIWNFCFSCSNRKFLTKYANLVSVKYTHLPTFTCKCTSAVKPHYNESFGTDRFIRYNGWFVKMGFVIMGFHCMGLLRYFTPTI